jgi:hypothetical protein
MNLGNNKNHIGFWLAIMLVSCIAVYYYTHAEKTLPPGILVSADPSLQLLDDTSANEFKVGQYTVKQLAILTISARVLSRTSYSFDRESDLSPVDFALGWGKMSDSSVLSYIDVTQSNRWYYWHYKEKPPVSDEYIINHSRNVHIIPINQVISNLAMQVKKNDVIQMSGYLVSITAPDGYHWKSYLSLEGEGDHTCLVYWVTDIKILK